MHILFLPRTVLLSNLLLLLLKLCIFVAEIVFFVAYMATNKSQGGAPVTGQLEEDEAMAKQLQLELDGVAYRERRPTRSNDAKSPPKALTSLGMTGKGVPLAVLQEGQGASCCLACEAGICDGGTACLTWHTAAGQSRKY